MPFAPKKPCSAPHCPNLTEHGKSRCPDHQRQYDAQRPTARARGYTARWAKTSRQFRERWPLCGQKADGTTDTVNSWCAKEGRVQIAECVQHIVPHQGEGDPNFYLESNLMSSCNKCNNKRRALREPGAFGR
jgi:5-methylcytosine-specific restriction endonuclease McrA